MKTKRKPRAIAKSSSKKSSPGRTTLLRAEGEQCFWVNNGPVLSDVRELERALRQGLISDSQWSHHARKGHNDFANWIEYVFRNAALAKKVRASKTRLAAHKILSAALKA